jgi:hypothetical protein
MPRTAQLSDAGHDAAFPDRRGLPPPRDHGALARRPSARR